MDQSIKGQVIALARRDPFLTVKDLAQEAGTTTRYVRTILSEVGLSLNEMRKEYAKRLERGIGAEHKTEPPRVEQELRITKVAGEKISPQVESWLELELFQASVLQTSGPLLSYVQLITPQRLTVQTGYVGLRELLPAFSLGDLETGRQKAEVVQAPEALAQVLGLPKFSQVLKLTTLLHKAGEPVALEVRWLGLDGLILEWSKLEPELKVAFGS